MTLFPSLRRLSGSLRNQLIVGNVIALSLLLCGLGVVCHFATLSFMIQSVDQELERGIDMYLRPPPLHRPPFENGGHMPSDFSPFSKDIPPPGPDFGGMGRHEPPVPGFGMGGHRPHPPDANNPYRSHLFTARGQSETPSDNRPTWDVNALARALQGETLFTTVIVDEDPIRVLSSPAFNHEGKKGAIQIAYPLKEVYRAIAGIDTALLLLIPLGLLCTGWMGSVLTGRVLKRVHHMTQAADHIGAADFSRRLPVMGNDEFSELAETFNGLLGRVDSAFQEQKHLVHLLQRFTADASHELKTPLTVIKGRASLALGRASTDETSRRTFQEIDTVADSMSKLVRDLLLLARSDEGHMGRDRTELLVQEILDVARREAASETSVPVILRVVPEELSVVGNEIEMIRLFRNLLENAVRYTPTEGQILVLACASGTNVVITVRDTGAGIAAEHLPHLGERFYRADASRSRPTGGTGLGLSICRSIVAAHRGSLVIESAPGMGTTVTVTIPAHLLEPIS